MKLTRPERAVSEILDSLQISYELHKHAIQGRPDFVLVDLHAVVFVDGCFWHAHASCKKSTLPQKNALRWLAQMNAQQLRDRKITKSLEEEGFSVLRLWECEISESHEDAIQRIKDLQSLISD